MTLYDKKELKNIQILRGVAAILVVFYHTLSSGNAYGFKAFSFLPFESWGSNGVDLFFVISGFIMTYIQNKNPTGAAAFLLNRAFRLIPLYWTLTIFIFIIINIFPSIFNFNDINIYDLIKSLSFTSFILYKKYPIIYDGWSLEYELIFYYTIGLSLLLKSISISNTLTIILIITISLLTREYIFLEFIFGMLIGLIYINNIFIYKYNKIILLIGLILFISTIFPHGDEINRSIYYGIPSAFIVYGLVFNRSLNYLNSLVKIGNASYSIYLVQVITIPFFYKIINRFYFFKFNNDLMAIVCIFNTIIFGYFIYYFVETKFQIITNKIKIIINNK